MGRRDKGEGEIEMRKYRGEGEIEGRSDRRG
jgi:hypothetical protein